MDNLTSSTDLAVRAAGLVKTFGDQRAVDGIDLEVRRGEIFGVLGPNGAGKTTMLRMLATLLSIDEGEAEIFGVDVRRQPHMIRQLLGVTGQYASVDENLTARENLWLFARLQGIAPARARATTLRLLEQFGLEEAADKPISQFSGGMRRRLDLAASLITRPPLIFLDEPTTGLDPRTRGQMWDTIRSLVADGCTVLLTTQYLDEADQLADRIAVIDRGRKVAEGTPDELKSSVGSSTLQLRLADRDDLDTAVSVVRRVLPDEPVVTPEAGGLNVALTDADRAAEVLIALRADRGQHRLGDRAEADPRRGVPGPDRPRHRRGRGRPDRHRDRPHPGGDPMTTTLTAPSARAGRPGATCARTSRVRETVSQTMTMAWRATKKMRRNPEQFFDVTLQPILFTAMFAYIFGGAISGDVQSYLPLMIPGILAQTVLTTCMATGIQLREDMDKGVFDRFKSMPIARIAPLAGPMVADLLRYIIATTLTFAMGIADGLPPGRRGGRRARRPVLLTIFTGWSLAWIFTCVGTIARSAQSVQGISLMILFPLTFLSNALRPGPRPCRAGCSASCRSTRSRTSWPRSASLANDGVVNGEVGWALLACVVGHRDLRAAVGAGLQAARCRSRQARPPGGVTRVELREPRAPYVVAELDRRCGRRPRRGRTRPAPGNDDSASPAACCQPRLGSIRL